MLEVILKPGDFVRVKSIPEWLTHDLPPEDQLRLRQHLGKLVRILKLQPHGFLWLSFEDGTEGFSLKNADVQLVQTPF